MHGTVITIGKIKLEEKEPRSSNFKERKKILLHKNNRRCVHTYNEFPVPTTTYTAGKSKTRKKARQRQLKEKGSEGGKGIKWGKKDAGKRYSARARTTRGSENRECKG